MHCREWQKVRLLGHPHIAQVAVVGVPDADFGEVGVAVVIAKPGFKLEPLTILANLKATLANFKVPKRCDVVVELPRNAMGKVQKNVLRNQYQSPSTGALHAANATMLQKK